MTNAYVLMTVMPPTVGHLNLVRFAHSLNVEAVHVIVCTQPSEPFSLERYEAVREATVGLHSVHVHWLHKELMQDPSVEGFWPMWDSIMESYGFATGDYAVSSELYGATLAERMGGQFFPYDPNRELYYTKATNIREHTRKYFHDILPEFQHNLLTTVTIFGAESTGKTTLSKELSKVENGHWLFEWARPYLESVGPEITREKMIAIWEGQLATQRHAKYMVNKPFLFQDTDLFSTIGYWEQPHWRETLGPVPDGLVQDALATKSDLYIVTKANIPFEKDSIRYGDGERESSDEFWLDIARKYGLRYVVLDESSPNARVAWAGRWSREASDKKVAQMYYDRMGL